MRKYWITHSILVFMSVFTFESKAFELLGSDTSTVTEILADHGMVCDQEKKQCTAEGNVRVFRGKSTLTCDKLVAYFVKNAQGKQELERLEAFGNVHIFSQEDGYDAKSAYGSYEVDTQLVTLKGNPVIKHKELEIHGTGPITYDQVKEKATTASRATVKKQEQLLQANELVAHFKRDEDNNSKSLDHLTAHGNVVVSSPTEIAQAEYGSYYEATSTAELWNNVVITRYDGQIRGPRAKVDMKSGESRMLHPTNSPIKQQRVQALLLPKEKDKVKAPSDDMDGQTRDDVNG